MELFRSFKWKCCSDELFRPGSTWRISYVPNLMQIQKHLLFLLIADDASLDLSVVPMIGGAAWEICFNQ